MALGEGGGVGAFGVGAFGVFFGDAFGVAWSRNPFFAFLKAGKSMQKVLYCDSYTLVFRVL